MRVTARRLYGLTLTLSLALAGCTSHAPSDRHPQPSTTATPAATEGSLHSVHIVAAGDIGSSPTSGARTARLVQSLHPDWVLTIGDHAYPGGSLHDFRANYRPTWGSFRDITRPAPGNHEYLTPDAAGYFHYFRHQVHHRSYYAWNAGRWRMYSLNCEIPCGSGSAQLNWLADDLRTIGHRPALGYVHEPPFSCAYGHEPDPRPRDMWRVLQRANGRIMLTAHDHAYERFVPMRADGTPAAGAVREFVVGTGGATTYPLRYPCAHREAQAGFVHGVLDLTLRPHAYGWRFVRDDGTVLDSGRRRIG